MACKELYLDLNVPNLFYKLSLKLRYLKENNKTKVKIGKNTSQPLGSRNHETLSMIYSNGVCYQHNEDMYAPISFCSVKKSLNLVR